MLTRIEDLECGELEQIRKEAKAAGADPAERWLDFGPLLDQLLAIAKEKEPETIDPFEFN